jgi:hypothetical protein
MFPKTWPIKNGSSSTSFPMTLKTRTGLQDSTANGTDNCSFTVWFENHGKLHVMFIDRDLGSNYILRGNKFETFYFWKMQVVWVGDDECPLNPERLNWTKSEFEYKFVGSTLIVENQASGNNWTLIQL